MVGRHERAGTEPVTLPLTGGREALIDAEDYDRLSPFTWRVMTVQGGNSYACRDQVVPAGRKTRNLVIYLAREVLRVKSPTIRVRFRNGNTLDCRKANLDKSRGRRRSS